ncbi:tripartite tricarboxylate transporter TctB family protein [Halomonas sp. JS92-SW72]|nr:tripartite tricarboxylate transporter TctB family protein [Halomonas sp. JS92-SW72]
MAAALSRLPGERGRRVPPAGETATWNARPGQAHQVAQPQGVLVADDGEESGRRFERGPWLRFALMVLALVVYVGLFEMLGAIISGILATLILFVAHPVRTLWVYSLAVAFPVGVSLLFTEVMNVPLPMLPF